MNVARLHLIFAYCTIFSLCIAASAQGPSVAITVDDLPCVNCTLHGLGAAYPAAAKAANTRLLAPLIQRQIPVTGFVVEQGVHDLGKAGPQILQDWIDHGFDLGNHTYSHPDINDLSIEQIESETTRGEATIRPLMQQAGRKLQFFRFPNNHTGDTPEKHDAIAAFLAQRGYQLATCTIDNEDYRFAAAYIKALEAKDSAWAARIRTAYLAYTAYEIDFSASLNEKAAGHATPQVMLLHDNLLNADTINDVLDLFTQRGYKFVSLAQAQSDPAYSIPEVVAKSGIMWGYRWAQQRHVSLKGSHEQEPPEWIFTSGTPPPQ